jgi:hypothetical protein
VGVKGVAVKGTEGEDDDCSACGAFLLLLLLKGRKRTIKPETARMAMVKLMRPPEVEPVAPPPSSLLDRVSAPA